MKKKVKQLVRMLSNNENARRLMKKSCAVKK